METETENWLFIVKTQAYKLKQLLNIEIKYPIDFKERNVRRKVTDTDMADGKMVEIILPVSHVTLLLKVLWRKLKYQEHLNNQDNLQIYQWWLYQTQSQQS